MRVNSVKQKVAWLFYQLDKLLVKSLNLKRETSMYWWSVTLDANNEIHRSSTSNDYLGL